MRRILWVLVLLCLLFTACGSQKIDDRMQSAIDFRTTLMQNGGCSFMARVNADYGERVYEFTMQCQYFADREAHLTIIEPEMISGITAVVRQDGATVEFHDIELDFGTMANGRIAPMTLPWLLGKAWSSEYIQSAGKDGDGSLVTYLMGYADEELVVETWFGPEMVPLRCEISHGGVRYLTVTVSEFILH